MKKNQNPIQLKGAITLNIDPHDPLLWKLSMLLEAASCKAQSVEQIAAKYGYTREYFSQVLDKFNHQGSQGLQDQPSGPKTNYRRTEQVTKQIILHRFLDPEASCAVITQKMQQAGHQISQSSVERVIQSYGLQKKGYIKQIRSVRKSP